MERETDQEERDRKDREKIVENKIRQVRTGTIPLDDKFVSWVEEEGIATKEELIEEGLVITSSSPVPEGEGTFNPDTPVSEVEETSNPDTSVPKVESTSNPDTSTSSSTKTSTRNRKTTTKT